MWHCTWCSVSFWRSWSLDQLVDKCNEERDFSIVQTHSLKALTSSRISTNNLMHRLAIDLTQRWTKRSRHSREWRNRQSIGLMINRSWVQILLGAIAAWQPWANCSHLCASVTKQYNLVPANGWWCSVAGKVTAGLAESKSSLPPGGWLIVTCGLTAGILGSAPGPTFSNKYGKPLLSPFYYAIQQHITRIQSKSVNICTH